MKREPPHIDPTRSSLVIVDMQKAFLERRDGRDTVIIAGIATNVCVESTAREAFALGFRVVVLSDAVSTGNAEAHAASLKTLSLAFGWVITTSQLRECMVKPRES